jgi:hypothetical protein
LPVVLCGRGTSSLTFREEHRLEVSENWVLRRICRSKRDEMIGWRRLHNEEFHNLYSSSNDQVKESDIGKYGEKRNAYKIDYSNDILQAYEL